MRGVFVWADDITAKGVPFHRGIEVQVLENAYGNTKGYSTHGDIFPIHGAKMTPENGRGGARAFPTENRSNPSPEWNHYRITCIDGNISLAVNEKVVTQGKECNPRKGYICIESEGGVVHYRNVRIKELPNSPIKDEFVAITDRGYQSIYNGIDLKNWSSPTQYWKPNDWVLECRCPADQFAEMQTIEEYGDCKFLFDMRRKHEKSSLSLRVARKDTQLNFGTDLEASLSPHLSKPGRWDRIEGEVLGNTLTVSINGKHVLTQKVTATSRHSLEIKASGEIDFANIYVAQLESVSK